MVDKYSFLLYIAFCVAYLLTCICDNTFNMLYGTLAEPKGDMEHIGHHPRKKIGV